MELVYIDVNENYSFDRIVATIGEFDGIHQGHVVLLEETIKIGKAKNIKTAVITFDPHPDFVLGKEDKINYITPFNIKKQIIDSYGFDYMFVIKFTNEVANTSPDDFVKKYLLKLNVVHTVVGFDFKFGKRGLGKANDISLYSNNLIENTIIYKVQVDKKKVASQDVKKSLVNGEVDKAMLFLNRPYEIIGKVVYGKQIGTSISVPTANITYDEEYALLKNGVYATIIVINNKEYPSITNIGHNPSFNYTKLRSLETHIIDFNENIYGKIVTVKFYKRLRDEVKFASIDDFLNQISHDKEEALKILSHL